MLKYADFQGIEKAREIVSKFGDNVLVYFDPDVDGMIAGYLACKFLQSIGKRFQWYVNTNREHNWHLDTSNLRGWSILAVDFLIPKDTMHKIVQSGCNIISMDHHVNNPNLIWYKSKICEGIIINNQYEKEPEEFRFLSGAGVVFNTLIKLNPSLDTEENRALVGLTLLSDVCDIENPIAKEYLKTLYNCKYKGYIKYLIDGVMGEKDYGFGIPRLDRNFVDFTFSPAINSCLRFNQEEMVVQFFLGMCKLDLTCHQRQKELVSKISEIATVREFSHLRVVFFKDWELGQKMSIDLLSNFVGLVASRFLNGKKSVICYVISKNSDGTPYVGRASFRGAIGSVNYLNSLKKFINGVGHQPAFGIIGLLPTRDLFESINEACMDAENGQTNSKKITPVSNLSIFASRMGKAYADYNMYCLSQHRKYLRYIGKGAEIKVKTNNYIEYSVDGICVKCFDSTLNFNNGLILPIMERGYIYYYLQPES